MKFKPLLIFIVFVLAACGSEVEQMNGQTTDEEENVTSVPAAEREETVTHSNDENVYYQTLKPYENSSLRGLTRRNMITSNNIEAFEKELFDISKNVFHGD